MNSEEMKIGFISYSIEVIIHEENDYFKKHSPVYHEALISSNTPNTRKVYFNNELSAIYQDDSEYGHLGKVIKVMQNDHPEYLYYKSMPYLEVYTQMVESQPLSGEFVPSEITLLDDYKKILNFKCRKAVIKENGQEIHVWFTNDIEVPKQTKGLISNDLIDGVILELEEFPDPEHAFFHKRITVSEINLNSDVKAAIFQIPTSAIKVENMAEAISLNKEKMEDSLGLPSDYDEVNFLTGSWIFEMDTKRIRLEFLFNAETGKLKVQKLEDETESSFDASYFNDSGKLIIYEDNNNYRSYKVDSDEETLQDETYPFIIYRKTSN